MPASRRRPPPTADLGDAAAIIIGLRRIVRALELYSHEVRRDFGLTAPQLWALKTLARNGPQATGELARALLVQQSSTSILLRRLERRGLVRRVRQRDDRRYVRIELTERGATVAKGAPTAAQGRLLHGLEAMAPRRLRDIRRAIGELVDMMEAEDVEGRFFFADG